MKIEPASLPATDEIMGLTDALTVLRSEPMMVDADLADLTAHGQRQRLERG